MKRPLKGLVDPRIKSIDVFIVSLEISECAKLCRFVGCLGPLGTFTILLHEFNVPKCDGHLGKN